MYEYNRSRLDRKINKEKSTQSVLTGLGILLVLFVVFKFGFSIITGISGVFIKVNEMTTKQGDQENKNSPMIPLIDPLPTATNSASVKISGKLTNSNGQIQIFVNNSLKVETDTQNNGNFQTEFSGLEEGNNDIKIRAKLENNTYSLFSRTYAVAYIKTPPKLEVIFPSENQIFPKGDEEITLTGKTDAENKVTVNGFWAVIDNSGNFSYFLKLVDGENIIKVEAEDIAGNKALKEVKVRYQP